MDEPAIYMRKTFTVRAIRVTGNNVERIARWCGGVVDHPEVDGQLVTAVAVPVRDRTGKHINFIRAYYDMWVTRLTTEDCFRVYSDRTFRQGFEIVDNRGEETLAKVVHLVKSAMMKQHVSTQQGATEIDTELFGEHVAKLIMKVV